VTGAVDPDIVAPLAVYLPHFQALI